MPFYGLPGMSPAAKKQAASEPHSAHAHPRRLRDRSRSSHAPARRVSVRRPGNTSNPKERGRVRLLCPAGLSEIA